MARKGNFFENLQILRRTGIDSGRSYIMIQWSSENQPTKEERRELYRLMRQCGAGVGSEKVDHNTHELQATHETFGLAFSEMFQNKRKFQEKDRAAAETIVDKLAEAIRERAGKGKVFQLCAEYIHKFDGRDTAERRYISNHNPKSHINYLNIDKAKESMAEYFGIPPVKNLPDKKEEYKRNPAVTQLAKDLGTNGWDYDFNFIAKEDRNNPPARYSIEVSAEHTERLVELAKLIPGKVEIGKSPKVLLLDLGMEEPRKATFHFDSRDIREVMALYEAIVENKAKFYQKSPMYTPIDKEERERKQTEAKRKVEAAVEKYGEDVPFRPKPHSPSQPRVEAEPEPQKPKIPQGAEQKEKSKHTTPPVRRPAQPPAERDFELDFERADRLRTPPQPRKQGQAGGGTIPSKGDPDTHRNLSPKTAPDPRKNTQQTTGPGKSSEAEIYKYVHGVSAFATAKPHTSYNPDRQPTTDISAILKASKVKDLDALDRSAAHILHGMNKDQVGNLRKMARLSRSGLTLEVRDGQSYLTYDTGKLQDRNQMGELKAAMLGLGEGQKLSKDGDLVRVKVDPQKAYAYMHGINIQDKLLQRTQSRTPSRGPTP